MRNKVSHKGNSNEDLTVHVLDNNDDDYSPSEPNLTPEKSPKEQMESHKNRMKEIEKILPCFEEHELTSFEHYLNCQQPQLTNRDFTELIAGIFYVEDMPCDWLIEFIKKLCELKGYNPLEIHQGLKWGKEHCPNLLIMGKLC
jgi:hypothetical protein